MYEFGFVLSEEQIGERCSTVDAKYASSKCICFWTWNHNLTCSPKAMDWFKNSMIKCTPFWKIATTKRYNPVWSRLDAFLPTKVIDDRSIYVWRETTGNDIFTDMLNISRKEAICYRRLFKKVRSGGSDNQKAHSKDINFSFSWAS